MNFSFDIYMELIYGLDYCINREKNNIKQYNTKENNKYLDEFYNIYLNNISQEVKDRIEQIGEYQKKAEYILNKKDLSFININAFEQWFEKIKVIQNRIIEDIKNDKYLENFDLTSLKEFYDMDLGKVEIILSMFISGGFGLSTDNTYCILGVKYNSKLEKYRITGTLISKIYHEVSHPYIKKSLLDKKLNIQNNDKVDKCYRDSHTEELLARIIEIIFASKIYGKEYLSWALKNQEEQGFVSVKKYIDLYYKNENIIKNFNDLIELISEKNESRKKWEKS